jgi:5-amino-6-(5-phosphoribosylamino)uracil reductase
MTVRALLPEPGSVDLVSAYAPPPGAGTGVPFVRVNMISSIDGAVTVDGRSGPLGGDPDRRVFAVLRAWADVIVVGAGTMRAEGYGPVRLDAEAQAAREARGQHAIPPIAVVSGSARFDYATPFFADAVVPPIIVTTNERAAAIAGDAANVADVVGAGTGEVDLGAVIQLLAQRGYPGMLVEGGPTLNGDLAAARVIDELCLTFSPRIVMGNGPRILAGPVMSLPIAPHLVHLLEDDGFLFARYAFPRRA